MYALEAIWQAERDSDLVVCTGDLVDYGPEPQAVVDWMRDQDALCTQGNHDAFLVRMHRRGHIGDKVRLMERMWVHHNAARLDAAAIDYLDQLPPALTFEADGRFYAMTHLYDEYQEIVSIHAFEQFCGERFVGLNGRLPRLIFGHTHRQSVRLLSDRHLWLNPGSASYRRRDDPDQTAHYATIVNGRIALHRLAYDITPLRRYGEQVAVRELELERYRNFFAER